MRIGCVNAIWTPAMRLPMSGPAATPSTMPMTPAPASRLAALKPQLWTTAITTPASTTTLATSRISGMIWRSSLPPLPSELRRAMKLMPISTKR